MKYTPIVHRGARHHRTLPHVKTPCDRLLAPACSSAVHVERRPAAAVECRVKASIGKFFAYGSSEDDALMGLFFKVALRNQNFVLQP
jgi:hypothetical protein